VTAAVSPSSLPQSSTGRFNAESSVCGAELMADVSSRFHYGEWAIPKTIRHLKTPHYRDVSVIVTGPRSSIAADNSLTPAAPPEPIHHATTDYRDRYEALTGVSLRA
jgi:hypothetical protein